jgi:hypothetical protein
MGLNMNRSLIEPRRQLLVFALAVLALAALAAVASANTNKLQSESISASAYRQTTMGIERGQLSTRSQSSLAGAESEEIILPEQLELASPPSPPPAASMRAELIPLPTVVPTPAPASPTTMTVMPTGTKMSGIASTYCCTRGFSGQAVVALAGGLGGRYTGDINGYVTVCADRCATFPTVDYCQCYWGTADQRLVDLSPEAWYAISDLPRSRGLLEVQVTLDR